MWNLSFGTNRNKGLKLPSFIPNVEVNLTHNAKSCKLFFIKMNLN